MAASPVRSTLYRTAWGLVILSGMFLVLAQSLPAQSAGREASPKGPRALGLVELAANGKAHLIPIVILYEGKFYDAGAFKASPVPMALEPETVYEALRAGVSQGLFTVTDALRAKDTWIAEGKWRSASEIAAAAGKKPAASSKPADADLNTPPVLRRADSAKPKAPEPASSAPAPGASTPAPPAASSSPPPPASAPPSTASSPAAPNAAEDPNRPVLRRGKPAPRTAEQESRPSAAVSGKAAASPSTALAPGPVQLIPAVSDAGGPDPRPYSYAVKPEDEQKFRAKMLAFAADEVRARARQLAAQSVEPLAPGPNAPRQGKSPAGKSLQPSFEDVQVRAFDLSNSNEPVLVLTARARMPQRANPTTGDLQYYVALVARNDIYGELHQAFSNVTDTQHLDALPRFELVDAVDADGDGRGELLFRQISSAGNAFVVYRVIGDRLWALFQGAPAQ